MALDPESIEKKPLPPIVHGKIKHDDACPAVPQVQLAQSEGTEEVRPGRMDKGDQGLVSQVSGSVDIPGLHHDLILKLIPGLFLKLDAGHAVFPKEAFL
jgi:hypothetical protein